MKTLQTAKDLKKFKRQQAFIMVQDSQRCAFNKGTVATLRGGIVTSVIVKPLHSKRLRPMCGTVDMSGSELYEDPKVLAPFTIGMSVKPHEGWKVLKP